MLAGSLEEHKLQLLQEKSNTDESSNHTVPVLIKIKSKMVLISRNGSFFQAIKPALLKVQSCCSTCVLIICLVLLILSLLAVIFKPLNKVTHTLVIDLDEPIRHVTNLKFLSIAIDSMFIAHGFRDCNISDPKLVKLMKPLAPGYLRIGGTMADRLVFTSSPTFIFKTLDTDEIDGGECSYEDIHCDAYRRHNYTMNGHEWLLLNKLASDAGFTMLFDLNVLRRFHNGTWNYTNAEELIAFSQMHNLNITWELGNEPDRFRNAFNCEVNATQLAYDFKTLRNILDCYPMYRNSLLVGPDTTRPQPSHKASEIYFKKFLETAGNVLNAITWHQYYFSGKTAKASDFVNPDIFDVLYDQINMTKTIVKKLGLQAKPIWLGETSSAYSSGAPGYSDRYISTFIWLDKLGVAAKAGLDLVVRQTLFQGYYALLDRGLEPNPDWWVSVLYKMLVGPEVVTCYDMSHRYVRLYCQCTKKSLYGVPSSVIVYGMNMKSTEAKVKIEGILPGLHKETATVNNKVYAYVLTPYLNLLTKHIQLNDDILYLLPDGSLPPLNPKIVNPYPYLIMPPYSLVFWVVPSPYKHCTSRIF